MAPPAAAEPDISLGAVRIWPFAATPALAGKISGHAERRFRAWASEHAHLYAADAAAPPTPAAAKVLALLQATATTCLRARLVATPPTATLHLALRPPVPIGDLARPSDALRRVFWHLSRTAGPPARLDDTCGFVGCAARCFPAADRAPYKLSRVFAASTRATAPSPASTHASTPATPSPPRRPRPAEYALQDLPNEILLQIALALHPRDLASFARTSSYFAAFVKPIVPALRLRLFPHQAHALDRMQAMERRAPTAAAVPLLHRIEFPQHPKMVVAVDLVENNLFRLMDMPVLRAPRGGLFCDEPGLGKTITALALVLKTLGTEPVAPEGVSVKKVGLICVHSVGGKPVDVPVKSYEEALPGRFRAFADDTGKRFPTRRAMLFPDSMVHDRRTSTRGVRQPDFLEEGRGADSLPLVQSLTKATTIFLSAATIIIVPNVLTDHWSHQIQEYVDSGKLRALVVLSANDFPEEPGELAARYDIVIASFEAISQLFNAVRGDTPSLMRVHFLRIIVDEGHTLSNASVSHFGHVCARIRAERRWVMTGTPTPSTSRSDLEHLQGLLMFIREEGYGMDRKAWNTAVREPYIQFRPESLEMLGELLNRVMIRADKSVLESRCHIKNVVIDFDEEQASGYNWLVSLARRNLITSDWYSEKHQESLLNSKNWKLAQLNVKNLRYACNMSGTQHADFTERDIISMLDDLYEKFRDKANIEENDRFDDPVAEWPLLKVQGNIDEEVRRKQADLKTRLQLFDELRDSCEPYVRLCRRYSKPVDGKVFITRIYSGVLHDIAESFLNCKAHCACCYESTTIPMVTPCGHLLCENCIISDRTRCVAQHCGEPYRLDENGVPEDLIELQPAAYSRDLWKPDWDKKRSAKMVYLLDRIRGLPMNEEWRPYESQARRTRPKIIVHSQFTDHLYYFVKELKESEDLANSYVEMGKNQMERDGTRRYKKASVIAREAIQEFRDNADKHILVMTTRNGSVGLDLSFVQYIFMLEPVWDLSAELQIVSRAHRIGATQDIHVERLVMRDSVEHEMMRDLEKKLSGEADMVSMNAEGKKDLSRIRKILRELKPVTGEKHVKREAGASSNNGAGEGGGSKRARPEDGEEGQAQRVVRFRSV